MRGIATYRKGHVQAASQSQLLLMLLRKAVLKLDEAEACHEEEDWTGWQACLHHVRAIYSELIFGLDDESSPELCGNLRRLYLWSIRELSSAASSRELAGLASVRRVTTTLLDGWVDGLGDEG